MAGSSARRHPASVEFRLHSPDGTWRWINARVAPLRNPDGSIRKWVGMNVDVTERRAAEEALRQSAARQAFLVRLGDALRPLDDVRQICPVACTLLGEHLEVSRCTYADVDSDELLPCEGYANGVVSLAGLDSVNPFVAPLVQAQRQGEMLAISDVRTDPLFTDAEKAALLAADIAAFTSIPLLKEGRWVGSFSTHSARPRVWTQAEIELIREVAERVWTTLRQVRAETALREREERYRSLFESIDEGYLLAEVLYDAQGQPVDLLYHEANPAACRITGVGTYAGRRLLEIDPGFEPYWIEIWDRVARTGVPERLERYAAPLGQWYDFYVSRVGGGDGRLVAAVFQDITERKRADGALRQSEEKYRALFESIDEGLATLELIVDDNNKVVDYRFVQLNPALTRLTGLDLDILGKRVSQVLPNLEQEWFERLERVALTGEPERFELPVAVLNGWCEVNVSRIGAAGSRLVSTIYTNVTERKQAEAERERLVVAEAVAAERQALLKRIVRAQEEERAKVAHEVHDSFTQLAHAAAIHLDEAVELLPHSPERARPSAERGRDLARQAANEARRLIAGLRPEMLDFAGLPGAIQQEVDALRRAGWRADLEDGDLAGVRLDPETEITLYRVAQEALLNVRKHAGRTRVRVRLDRQNGSVRLEVRDWGRGFDPATVRPTADGEHVGLTGMRERMELLGGKLEVRSGPDHGTTVRATLPVLLDAQAASVLC